MKQSTARRAAAALALAGAVSGCSSSGGSANGSSPATSAPASTAEPSPIDISGTVTLLGPISTGVDSMKADAPCVGITSDAGEDFEDVGEGLQLEVHDGTGATVGIGSLGASHMTVVNPLESRECAFDFTISGIAPGKGIYQIFIGSHATEKISEADLPTATDLTLQSALYSG